MEESERGRCNVQRAELVPSDEGIIKLFGDSEDGEVPGLKEKQLFVNLYCLIER